MSDRTMQIASGCVTSVSQKTISTKVWSNNLGTTTQSIEEIALQLDTVDAPLTLRTDSTRSVFIVAGDRLTVAYTQGRDRRAIYAIRNATDGSVYLVRTAKAAAARTDVVVTIGMLVAMAITVGLVSAMERSTDSALEISTWFGGAAIALFLLSTILRTVFGIIIWPEIRRLRQPGGKREMNAARSALSLSNEETPHIRFI
ncbi:hypothetical protein B7G54_20380 [Burkholderia puraquae]|uniref:Uncharacterized protein n=2 Tax=Burkholderia puraquae TaxID=1904757 RepID=A0A1X1PEI4_9BURK|nr:hypothetical protein [Burkholderia puraquae]ORT84359.1 hypothetical protein B7G54_20380 [Burkholderia puraquae]CAB3752673.1 hypothetical protein LMG29660_01873 [Burkholderia puraquae]